ncbi:hypothetical protein TRICI_004414 [Trichomonascus ciferrii]|uniref:Uncharacterized protein n=1 Tax=Trichomonascus ciferrii TaxID=44093 RepID=A0A642V153_9ASCO|nr:hypothetical protein TRICI_004414 [Trichomonascus ciferrii]
MPAVSSKTLILARSAVLLSLGFFLIKDPALVTTNRYVLVMAQAMEMPLVILQAENPLIGLSAILLSLLALADIPPLFSHNYIEFLDITGKSPN